MGREGIVTSIVSRGWELIASSQTGMCVKEISDHTEVVGSLKWLPDNLGFVTTGMDTKLCFYVCILCWYPLMMT